MARCPTCRKDAQPRAQNAAFPFCSARCRAIDLGKWFNGEYRVPGRPAQPEELEGQPEQGASDEPPQRR